ncbi:MAG: hypothetical protein M3O15_09265, partial [Acidobacteriota bacterium]|nr:hypothetical protein [Acidobacteriota bacterium]
YATALVWLEPFSSQSPEGTARILRSGDSGATWHLFAGDATAPALDPAHPGTLYAAQSGLSPSHVLKSTRDGRSWTSLGFPESLDVVDLLVDPLTPTTLYSASIARDGIDVERSTDGGLTWSFLGLGPDPGTFRAAELFPHPSVPHLLFVGVEGGGFVTARFP